VSFLVKSSVSCPISQFNVKLFTKKKHLNYGFHRITSISSQQNQQIVQRVIKKTGGNRLRRINCSDLLGEIQLEQILRPPIVLEK